MSCSEETKRQQILDHLAHTPVICDSCQTLMTVLDGSLAFGNAQLVTFLCEKCHTEKIYVCDEKGEIYEALIK